MNPPTFLWLILLPAAFSALAYLVGRLVRRETLWYLPYATALVGLLTAWLPFGLAASQLTRGETLQYQYGSIALRMDALSLLLSAITLGLGTLVVLCSGPYLSKESGQEKFYAMLLLMISMIVGLACATDLFNLWIWFEAMAVTSYLLVAFYRQQPASLEAGFKYLVQNAAGSVLVVVGVGLVFAATGSLSLADIRAAGSASPLLLAASALFVIGFGVE